MEHSPLQDFGYFTLVVCNRTARCGALILESPPPQEGTMMIRLAVVLVNIYIFGIAAQLGPTIVSHWSTLPASEIATKVTEKVPDAARWPVRAYQFAAAHIPDMSQTRTPTKSY
jgi:hypothetical protein